METLSLPLTHKTGRGVRKMWKKKKIQFYVNRKQRCKATRKVSLWT